MHIRFADIELDMLGYLLRRAGERIPLRPKAFDLLFHLVRNRDRVVPRDELVGLLWGETVVGPGSLSGLVNELRTALGERGGMDSSIRTVHARGYQFIAEVLEENGEGRPVGSRDSGAQFVPEPRLPAEVVDEIRDKLSVFIADEIRPLLEFEGLEHLFGSIAESIWRDLVISEGRSRPGGRGPAEGRPDTDARPPDRRMRWARSARPREERGAG